MPGFLATQEVPGASASHELQLWNELLLQGALALFSGERCSRTKHSVPGVLIVSLLVGLLSGQSREICVYSSPHILTHLSLWPCNYIYFEI